MLTHSNKHQYRLMKAEEVNIFNTPTKILNLVTNNSFIDILDSVIYYVIMDYDYISSFRISELDADLLISDGYGFYRNITNGSEASLDNFYNNLNRQFVFAKSYPNNYVNCDVGDNSNKPVITYRELKLIGDNEPKREYEDIILEKDNLFIIKNQIVYSNEVAPDSGVQHDNYKYWEFFNKPKILYKYIKRI